MYIIIAKSKNQTAPTPPVTRFPIFGEHVPGASHPRSFLCKAFWLPNTDFRTVQCGSGAKRSASHLQTYLIVFPVLWKHTATKGCLQKASSCFPVQLRGQDTFLLHPDEHCRTQWCNPTAVLLWREQGLSNSPLAGDNCWLSGETQPG